MFSGSTILCVDDEEDCLGLVRASFEHAAPEIRVLTRPDATSALATLSVESVDAVVSDSVTLPNGTPFVEEVRNEHPALPIVLYSGRDFSEISHTAARARVADYIQKGAVSSSTDLVSRVRTLVDDESERAPASRLPADAPTPTEDADEPTDFWKTPPEEAEWTELGRCDPGSETDLLLTLVDALGIRANERPLADAFDPEALASLFDSTAPSTGLRVRLTLAEWDVVISEDGRIMGRKLTLA